MSEDQTLSQASSEVFDLVVVGCGGIGSAVLEQSARRGARVLGIDRFEPPHSFGSSHGHSRIIRQAYFEHPDYVPLLLEAYDGWYDLEQRFGSQLFFKTGLIQSGPADGEVVPGVLQSASQNQLEVEHLSSRQANLRFPMFRFPENHEIAYEPAAGYLLVERCVEAHWQQALAFGAVRMTNTTVFGMRSDREHVELATDRGIVRAHRVVVTAGAWSNQLLAECRIELTVLRKHLHWFECDQPELNADRGCPLFLFELEEGCFYGFPKIAPVGVKIAEHSGGEPLADPSRLDRSVDPTDLARNLQFIEKCIPGTFRHLQHDVCLYTMSSDQHFVIDQHPNDSRVLLACGFSGHGFKFATVLGKTLSQWSLDGTRDPRLEFLGIRSS